MMELQSRHWTPSKLAEKVEDLKAMDLEIKFKQGRWRIVYCSTQDAAVSQGFPEFDRALDEAESLADDIREMKGAVH